MTIEQIDVVQLMWGNEIHVKSKCVLVMYFPHNSHAELLTYHQYLFSHLPRGETHIKICNKQKIRVNLFLRHLCRQMHMKILFAFCTIMANIIELFSKTENHQRFIVYLLLGVVKNFPLPLLTEFNRFNFVYLR